jgi:hypothetical protein
MKKGNPVAIEHPPASTFGSPEALKTYRPDRAQTLRIHEVKDQTKPGNPTEDLISVARVNGVDVVQLIAFNFPGSVINGKVKPEVVNWYLHYHKEFDCPDTRNGKNRMFRGGERLYIPRGKDPVPPPADDKDPLKGGVEFEFSFPERRGGSQDLIWKIGGAVKGKFIVLDSDTQAKGNINWLKRQVGADIGTKLQDELEVKFGTKFDIPKLRKATSPKEFLTIIGDQTSLSLKDKTSKNGLFARLTHQKMLGVSYEFGVQFSVTPVFAKVGLEFAPFDFKVLGVRVVISFTAELKLSIGPGPRLLGFLLEEAAPWAVAAAPWALSLVVSTGILIGVEQILREAGAQGTRKGCLSWYTTGYVRAIFPSGASTAGPLPGPQYALMLRLYNRGRVDALQAAQRSFPGDPDPVGNYRNFLISTHEGKYQYARDDLTNTINAMLEEKFPGLL